MCDIHERPKLSPQNRTTHFHLTPKLKMRGFYIHSAEILCTLRAARKCRDNSTYFYNAVGQIKSHFVTNAVECCNK